MVENRSLMEVDLFSYTRAGAHWKYPGLWVEVLMYLIYDWAGPGGLNLLTASLVTFTFLVVWKTLNRRGFLSAFVIILAAATSGIYWSARPYLISFLLAAVFIWFFEGYQASTRRNLWVIPVLMVLWVNSHGAFLVGFLIWVCYFSDSVVKWFIAVRQGDKGLGVPENVKHLLLIGVLMGVALVINPQGLDILSLPFTTVSRGAEQLYIEEWQSPNFHETRMLPFAVLMLLTFGAMCASNRRVTIAEFFLVAGFGFLGLLAGRFISIFAVIAPVIMIRHAEEVLGYWGELLKVKINIQIERQPSPILSWVNRVLVVLLFGVVIFKVSQVLPREANFKVFQEQLPVSAVEFIQREKPEGRMFNSYNFGGYLIWALPEYPVFIDGRADLHGDEIIFEWLSIARAEEGWEDALAEWGVGFVLVEPGLPLVDEFEGESWVLIYSDEVAVVYQHSSVE
jgi:hypothetical protein